MVGFLFYWTVIYCLAYEPSPPPPWPQDRLATPDELSAYINDRMLTSYRQHLMLTQLSISQAVAEEQPRASIATLRRMEADLKRRIEALEKPAQGRAPQPAPLPMLPDAPNPREKKPPVRD